MTYRPLTIREMRVYNCLLRETIDVAQELTARLRAIEIIAGMEATGLPIDEHFRKELDGESGDK